MIDIKELTEEDVGRWVAYKDRFWEGSKLERGRIKSWNNAFVFVVYKCAEEWDKYSDFTAAATNPKDLSFV